MLNKYILRPIHQFPSVNEITEAINSSSRIFCSMDALMGYFQIELDHASSLLTMFLLPWGRYRYVRAPMGCYASSDEWCCRSDFVVEGMPFVHKIVDDILVEAPDIQTLKSHIKGVLERCKAHGLIISQKKFCIGEAVELAGYIISKEGIKPDPAKVLAIKQFRQPENITEP